MDQLEEDLIADPDRGVKLNTYLDDGEADPVLVLESPEEDADLLEKLVVMSCTVRTSSR